MCANRVPKTETFTYIVYLRRSCAANSPSTIIKQRNVEKQVVEMEGNIFLQNLKVYKVNMIIHHKYICQSLHILFAMLDLHRVHANGHMCNKSCTKLEICPTIELSQHQNIF